MGPFSPLKQSKSTVEKAGGLAGASSSTTSAGAAGQDDRFMQIKRYAKATLGSGNLRQIVQLPEGEDEDEWIAVNTVDFFNQINLLYGTVTEFCTPTTCPVMNAGDRFEYLWQDDKEHRRPTKMSAPEYVDALMNWVQGMLDDEAIFPMRIGASFAKSRDPKALDFLTLMRKVWKRLFRVYAHLYHRHFPVIVALGMEPHLNTSLRHFVLFADRFKLVEAKEFAPLKDLVDVAFDPSTGSPRVNGGGGGGAGGGVGVRGAPQIVA